MHNDLTILLPEPDSYKDIVLFFDSLLKKAWPDCPYPIFWMNEEESINSQQIKAVNCGGGNPQAFCGRILDGIHYTDTKWVMIWVSDFLPTAKIDTTDIEMVLTYMEENDIKYCDLKKIPRIRMKKDKSSHYFYIENEFSPYNISIGFCVFEAAYLEEMIRDRNWTGWQLENYGMILSSEGRNSACAYCNKNIGHIVHLMARGRLLPSAVRKLERYGFSVSSLSRDILPKREEIRRGIRAICGYLCPIKLRKIAKIAMGKLGVQYGSKY